MKLDCCKKCQEFDNYGKGMFVSYGGGGMALIATALSNHRLCHCVYVLNVDDIADDCEHWFKMDLQKRLEILDTTCIRNVIPDDLCPCKAELMMQEWNDNDEK